MSNNSRRLKHIEAQAQLCDSAIQPTPRHAGNTPYRLLDAWRGVAALWVVLLHIRLHGLPAPLYAFSVGGLLGVPMFFVISGYCIANAAMRSLDKSQPAAHFVRARLRRIYPPYFFASLAAALFSLLLTALIAHHIVKSSQIAALNLLHQSWQFYVGAFAVMQVPLHTRQLVPVFWSLCYEVTFYCC
jgi:exopolysaccharide production protein ExoZ